MFFLPICLSIFAIIFQMPYTIECMQIPLDPSTANPPFPSNSTFQFPCLPITENGPPPSINEQEFQDCMQMKINKFSRIDNKTRPIFERVANFQKELSQFRYQKFPSNSPLVQEAIEIEKLLFDAKDMDKDGFLTADEISQFEMHFIFPYSLEMAVKDANHIQWERAFVFAYMARDLERTKAQSDKDAAKLVKEFDKNGDGKLNRDEMQKTQKQLNIVLEA